jgi:hypothetical protein
MRLATTAATNTKMIRRGRAQRIAAGLYQKRPRDAAG